MSDKITDKNSTEWVRVLNFSTRRIKELREQNDLDQTIVETASIRGSIKAFKEICEMGLTEKQIAVGDNSYID